MTTEIILILFLLVMKGFFSGSEIAMVNSDKLRLRHQARIGNGRAQVVLDMFRTPDRVLGTTLIGTNVATVSISTLGALICIDLFGNAGELISIVVLTPFLLILGEVVPKSIFQQRANEIVSRIAYLVRFFAYLFHPIILVFTRIARLGTRLGGAPAQNLFITREELRVLLDPSEGASDRSTIDRHAIRRIIRFADTTVGEAMIPLAEVVGFNEMRGMRDAILTVMQEGFNRLPIYRGNITNVKGVLTLSTWDLMNPDLEEQQIGDYTRPALYLSPRQTIDQILPLLQGRRDHMAIVVDEFGSAVGIITMEDVFEEVVGEIDVGYDFDEYQTKKRIYIEHESDDVHLMAGRMALSEVNDLLHLSFPTTEALTIGGLLISRLNRIPKEGDAIEESGCLVTVLEADSRSVIKVKLERMPGAAAT